jgi:3-hydroxybutyryl-CoA dehydratase
MDKQLKASTRHVDFDTIMAYAAVTNDYNPIHVDKAFAAKSPMGGIIAHGTMSVALIWQALRNTLGADALNRVHLEIRFVQPVRIDDDVTGGGERQVGGAAACRGKGLHRAYGARWWRDAGLADAGLDS